MIVYALLILWAAFVLFPLYWVVITSFKLPIDVNAGPVYLPWIDFSPTCTPGASCSSPASRTP